MLSGDRILLIAYGEVVAGVDLSRLEAEKVWVQDGSVRIQLPPAEVFSARIDNARTRVYSRQTGLLSAVDPHLETEARREAEERLKQAAVQDGILEVAERNARAALTSLLEGLGFQQIEFVQ